MENKPITDFQKRIMRGPNVGLLSSFHEDIHFTEWLSDLDCYGNNETYNKINEIFDNEDHPSPLEVLLWEAFLLGQSSIDHNYHKVVNSWYEPNDK